TKNKKLDFLIALTYPQPFRSEEEKQDWLKAALTHELEHVWQLLAIGDTLVEPPWLGIIEMCAVYAEHIAHSSLRCYQEWAFDFLCNLSMGLVNSGIVPDSPAPYWAFPFIHHLETTLPGIHRDLWTDPDMKTSRHVSQGPWMALDALLRAKSTSLKQEWNAFCQSVVVPSPESLPYILQERMPERHPTFTLELQDPVCAPKGDWPFPALSAHWIKVLSDPGKDWRLSWEFIAQRDNSELCVSISEDGRTWTSLDSTQSVTIPAGSLLRHLLFVHASTPDFSNVYIPKSASHSSLLPYAGLLGLTKEAVEDTATRT
ncbi:MAG: hypothetical protein NTV80_07230, partial [Verrucomicrobia bacterium]|nr:hypothetical protein [Verrucomicrobiota bacterium]